MPLKRDHTHLAELPSGHGRKQRKDNPRFDVLGKLDSLIVKLGYVKAQLCQSTLESSRFHTMVGDTQRLQELALELCKHVADPKGYVFDEDHCGWLEKKIKPLERGLPVPTNYVIPGAGPVSLAYHSARTKSRDVDRALVTIDEKDTAAARFILILQAYLFSAARYAESIEVATTV